MSMGAALKAARAVDAGDARASPIELLCACQAIDLLRPLVTSRAARARRASRARSVSPTLDDDRPPSPDIAAIATLIVDGDALNARARVLVNVKHFCGLD